jgi:NADH-quinone oxidoreductase subunit C
MTVVLQGTEIARQITANVPNAVTEANDKFVVVEPQTLRDVASFLKTMHGLEFNYLSSVTSVDYYSYFEVVYHLVSLKHNHSMVLKTRVYGRENPTVPSVVSLWRSADLQEREIFDLMGVRFEGHPNMKRIVLWEGFQGYPLRKDYLQ